MSKRLRSLRQRVRGMPTSDGAGVRLTRVIGTPSLDALDPFLMLDEFGTDRPQDYIAGFPDHPHRGFETVTYMLDGRMRHRDNHGNEGLLVPGSVQWMTAGRGLIHSEMPEQEHGRMRGFQLWINLPARDKLCAPRYQEYPPQALPWHSLGPGAQCKLIAGRLGDASGPIEQPATDPYFIDLALDQDAMATLDLPDTHQACVYVYEGEVEVVSAAAQDLLTGSTLGVLSEGEGLSLRGRAGHSRMIILAGRPLREPLARYGPFVMNTKAEIMQAIHDFQAGRFGPAG